nr:protein FAR1-related sequence 5 [Tanacetum cinerariifolium]
MEATIKYMISNNFRDDEEYAYHLEQSQNYLEKQIDWESRQVDLKRPKPNTFVFYYPQRNQNEPPRIAKVVSVTTEQQYRLDFMQRIIMMRGNDKLDSFSEAGFKYLNKNDIEIYKPTTGLIYLNIKNKKRYMDLEELSKFCDVTLEKEMEKQRYVQERLDHKTIDTIPKLKTFLSIARHALNVYTRSYVSIIKENPFVYEMPKKKKKSQSVDKGKDKDEGDDTVDLFFKKDGLFKVLRDVGDGLVNLIPATLRNKRKMYGEKNVTVENFANEETSIVDHCVHLLSKDEPRLDAFVEKLKLLKKDVEADNLEQLVEVSKLLVVDINNPTVGTNKGRRNLRIKRGKEKVIEKKFEEQEFMFIVWRY